MCSKKGEKGGVEASPIQLTLTVIGRLLDTFGSYFGGFTCTCWSPDGLFLAAGGQDDLITILSPRDGRVIARCQGHSSFITSIAFDPWRWSVEDRTYRFGSVGEDGKLLLVSNKDISTSAPRALLTAYVASVGLLECHPSPSQVSCACTRRGSAPGLCDGLDFLSSRPIWSQGQRAHQ